MPDWNEDFGQRYSEDTVPMTKAVMEQAWRGKLVVNPDGSIWEAPKAEESKAPEFIFSDYDKAFLKGCAIAVE